MGACVIDADAVYHDLLQSSAPLRSALTDRFGGEILDKAGKLDRKRMGNVVFQDPAALAELNGITHRFILAEIERLWRPRRKRRDGRSGHRRHRPGGKRRSRRCEAVVGVLAPPEVRIRRIMAREGIPEDYARRRVEAQQKEDFFRTHCGYILENDGSKTREQFRAEALALIPENTGRQQVEMFIFP